MRPSPAATSGDHRSGSGRNGPDAALVVACIATFQIGLGVLAAVIPVNLAKSGVPVSLAGLIISASSAGFLVGCLAAPAIVRSLGVMAALYAAVIVSGLGALLLWALGAGVGWIGVRGATGFCSGIVFTVLEAWLADRAPPGRRALYFSAYQVSSRVVYAAGQLSLAWIDPTSVVLFMLAGFTALLAPLPSLVVSVAAPKPGRRVFASMLDAPRRAPAAAATAFTQGAVTACTTSLFPLWAIAQGFTVERVAAMLVALQIAAIVLQFPVGYLADRGDRRVVMAGLALFSAALSAVAPTGILLPAALQPMLFGLWGASAYPLYSIAVAHMNDIATPEERVAWGGALLVLWGVGATSGPLLAAVVMDVLGVGALFAFVTAMTLGLFAFLVLRLNVKRRTRGPDNPDLPMEGPP